MSQLPARRLLARLSPLQRLSPQERLAALPRLVRLHPPRLAQRVRWSREQPPHKQRGTESTALKVGKSSSCSFSFHFIVFNKRLDSFIPYCFDAAQLHGTHIGSMPLTPDSKLLLILPPCPRPSFKRMTQCSRYSTGLL